jgi:hypothetical protein
MNTAATIARIAMWIMIGVIVLSFFISGAWVRIVWGIAAAICLICILIVAYSKNSNRSNRRR